MCVEFEIWYVIYEGNILLPTCQKEIRIWGWFTRKELYSMQNALRTAILIVFVLSLCFEDDGDLLVPFSTFVFLLISPLWNLTLVGQLCYLDLAWCLRYHTWICRRVGLFPCFPSQKKHFVSIPMSACWVSEMLVWVAMKSRVIYPRQQCGSYNLRSVPLWYFGWGCYPAILEQSSRPSDDTFVVLGAGVGRGAGINMRCHSKCKYEACKHQCSYQYLRVCSSYSHPFLFSCSIWIDNLRSNFCQIPWRCCAVPPRKCHCDGPFSYLA